MQGTATAGMQSNRAI